MNNKDIKITPADKGGTSVTMSRQDYIQEDMREVEDHYLLVTIDVSSVPSVEAKKPMGTPCRE